MKAQDLARCIDHTLLRADAVAKDIERLCAEAREHRFYAVCVNGSWVVQARHLLDGSAVKVATVVGFPLGATDSDTKRFETEAAIDNGAQEIDVVINVGRLKDGNYDYVRRELREAPGPAEEGLVKVILETGLLPHEEKIPPCGLVLDPGRYPPGLRAGDHVALVSAPTGPVPADVIERLREAPGILHVQAVSEG